MSSQDKFNLVALGMIFGSLLGVCGLIAFSPAHDTSCEPTKQEVSQ